jgi:hypothetical protein
MEPLTQALYELTTEAYKQSGGAPGAAGPGPDGNPGDFGGPTGGTDGVVDADYQVKDDK